MSAVESQVVGYQTVECAAETWYMVAAQFEKVDGTEQLPIQTIIANLDELTPGAGTLAPSIMRWTGSSYVTYYYLLNAEDGDGEPVHNVWARNGEMTEDSIDAARGFFIMFSGAENKTITFNK